MSNPPSEPLVNTGGTWSPASDTVLKTEGAKVVNARRRAPIIRPAALLNTPRCNSVLGGVHICLGNFS